MNFCNLFSFHLSLGQHATHLVGQTEAVNNALMQLFGRTGFFKKAVIFSDSVTAIQSTAKSDTLPSKRGTEIHSSIKLLKGLEKE
jgi:hypothetical protein